VQSPRLRDEVRRSETHNLADSAARSEREACWGKDPHAGSLFRCDSHSTPYRHPPFLSRADGELQFAIKLQQTTTPANNSI
jgi:hypothetical protein